MMAAWEGQKLEQKSCQTRWQVEHKVKVFAECNSILSQRLPKYACCSALQNENLKWIANSWKNLIKSE